VDARREEELVEFREKVEALKEHVEEDTYKEIEKIKSGEVTKEELEKVKINAKADFIYSFRILTSKKSFNLVIVCPKNSINTSFSIFSKLVERRMFREAVILAYQLFIKPLNIKKSWTPREICRRFRNVPGIKTITEIFERTYYGDIPPTESDVKECERFLRKR
ncbi:MAG TPA: DUF4129 domain-containing protein, partial [Aquificae bacterium]|nr:DUF4129 domain-containing protein [Aquificota bacterium]